MTFLCQLRQKRMTLFVTGLEKTIACDFESTQLPMCGYESPSESKLKWGLRNKGQTPYC